MARITRPGSARRRRGTKASRRRARQPKGRTSRATLLLSALGILGAAGVGAIATEGIVRGRLTDGMFPAPTRFYARPVVFQPGMSIDETRLGRTLERLGYQRTRRSRVAIGEYYRGSRRWIIGRRAFRHHEQVDSGGVATIWMGWGDRVYDIEDARGTTLPYFALEPEPIRSIHGASFEDRVPIRLADVPVHAVDAILSIEDQHFFKHHGLDVRRIAGATLANLRARRVTQGASTVTQQLAKNVFLTSVRSPVRKLREIALALALERRHDKEEILEAYLNQVYLGQDGAFAIHGIGRAAQFYFGKDVSQLELAEAALLAGIIRGPSLYAPFRNPDAALARRNLVLEVMHTRGTISEQESRTAQRAPLGVRDEPTRRRTGRYFVDYVVERLAETAGTDLLASGVSVFTTLDLELQHAAEDAVTGGLEKLERDYPPAVRKKSPLQAALVAINPSTGEILAMVGGRDYGRSQFNRAAHARRQPGSSFKPIVALAALSVHSPQFTLASKLDDEPLSLHTPAGRWEPENYDRQYRGSITMREALERSLNVPFARLGLAVGPERIVETARKLGIESRLNPVPSLALGSSEVTPLELTRAFGVLAANGYRAELNTTLGVLDREGGVLERMASAGEQVYDPAETYLVTSALRGAVERGTGRSLRALGYRGAVAAKSGTTNNFRDAWFIGYTPSLAIGVWVGFDDGRTIGLPGSRAALPIFARFLVGAFGRYGDDDEFSPPPGLEVVEVDQETGLRAGPGCRGERELFLEGTAPDESCSPYWDWNRRSSRSNSRWYERLGPVIDEVRRRLERRGRN